MKYCPNCNAAAEDNDEFCTNCGMKFETVSEATQYQQPQPNYQQPQQGYQQQANVPPYNQQNAYYKADPYDHTSEFDDKDISDNKVMAMALYLFGFIGIIIALLAAPNSPYVSFHLKQAMKFLVVNVLMSICALLLCWTFIVPLAYIIMTIVLFVIKIICFFQICSGKAKEPAIIRELKFLK